MIGRVRILASSRALVLHGAHRYDDFGSVVVTINLRITEELPVNR